MARKQRRPIKIADLEQQEVKNEEVREKPVEAKRRGKVTISQEVGQRRQISKPEQQASS